MEALIGIVGALIGAGAALAGTYISGRRVTRDERAREIRLAAAEHTKTLGMASHSIEWLTWKARFDPNFTSENIALYDQEIHGALANLVGTIAVVAALDPETYHRLLAPTEELYELDADVARIAAAYDENEAKRVIAGLSSKYDRAVAYHQTLRRSLADMFAAA